jgi:hypothetical protein
LLLGVGSMGTPPSAEAQSKSYPCGRKHSITRYCCKSCVAWSKGATGTFAGPCIRWKSTRGRCRYPVSQLRRLVVHADARCAGLWAWSRRFRKAVAMQQMLFQ